MLDNIDSVQSGLKDLYDMVRGVQSKAAQSVTEAAKDTQINAPVYVQNNIAQMDITPALLAVLNQTYASFILTAIGLNQYTTDNRTVREVVRSVSTEAWADAEELTEKMFGKAKKKISLEGKLSTGAVQLIDKESRLVSSKVIEVSLQLGKSKESSTKAYMTCTLIPRFISSEVVTSLVSLKYRPSVRDRWAQFTAGEISFWKDFVLCGDILSAERRGYKSDDSGLLYEIATNANNKLSQGLFETLFTGVARNNLASTILIVDKSTIGRISTKTHFDWDNYRARQKFFHEVSAVMIVMVDSMYNLVDVYYNGIKHKGEYTFDMIQKLSTNKNDVDMVKVMAQLAAGAAPQRF